ncbi:hypothetical protein [Pseudomonas sp. 31 R 17]|jgi:hypothetical protein|nr:hypothetical protein [Pseudomonas sp. 31 R 17]CRM16683.1 hypothetical protein [Pseudomonas sp. 31 R 17]
MVNFMTFLGVFVCAGFQAVKMWKKHGDREKPQGLQK